MANFRVIIIGILLFGLFAFAMINAGIMMASVNGANQSIGDDPSLKYYASELNSTLYDSASKSNTTMTALGESDVTLTSGFPVLDAISGVWKTLKVIPIQIWNLTKGLVFEKMLGSNEYAVVIGVIGAILLITILFAIGKWISTGDGG